MGRFDNKVALITGAARGQGAEEARRWVTEGGFVFITDVDDEAGRAHASALGPNAAYLHLDVSNENDWIAAMGAVAAWGPLHGLVNNAAIYQPQPMLETSVESFDRHIQINLRGCFLGMKYGAQAMVRSGGGAIVNIASSAGLRASPGSFAYCASKWGVRGMTQSAAASLASQGVRVNAVFPGPIDTDMIKFRTADQQAARLARVPMGRIGTSAEVAGMVLFLLSEESAYMTGAEITVDGGVTL
jgi:3alpha(or 20beta)-hydroxysteroid dehydrogenase